MKDITIIGGGMAGLAAAYYLQKQAQATGQSVTYRLLEKRDRLGGKIVTDRTDGFVIEGGPDSFITQKPWALELCRELGLEDQFIPCNEAQQKVYILNKGRLTALPGGFRLAVPTQMGPFFRSPLFSWPAKMRMALEPWIRARKGDEDESVASFIHRRLGREAVEKIAGPIMAGIYVADPERLSLQATFPMFRAMEQKHGSLIKAMRKAPARTSQSLPMFMSFRNGMAQLVETLLPQLTGSLMPGVEAQAIEPKDTGGFRVHCGEQGSFETDAVILAAPTLEAGKLLQSIDTEAARILNDIRHVSTATVSLGFRASDWGKAHPLNGFGFVAPKREPCRLLACTWNSTKFNQRAPEGHMLLRAFVGGARRSECVHESDSALIELVQEELRTVMGVQAQPVVSRIFRWVNGNPQYDVGHPQRMDTLFNRIAKIPNLHLAGSGYRGIGLPDCIHSGKTAAENAVPTNTAGQSSK